MSEVKIPFTTEMPPPANHLDYTQHIPEIERRIEALKPEAIVCGLGPSARLLPMLRKEVLDGVRLWGVNDFFAIMPCDDLVLMDSPLVPQSGLRQYGHGTNINPRWQTVVDSRPKRWWLYRGVKDHWTPMLPQPRVEHSFELRNWVWPTAIYAPMPDLEHLPHDHTMASPVGTVSIAWGEGARRIGLIGVDLLFHGGDKRRPEHHMANFKPQLSWFMSHFRHQAKAKGGLIENLSPFSTLNICKFDDAEPTRAVPVVMR